MSTHFKFSDSKAVHRTIGIIRLGLGFMSRKGVPITRPVLANFFYGGTIANDGRAIWHTENQV